jgi:WD40 repeat protein
MSEYLRKRNRSTQGQYSKPQTRSKGFSYSKDKNKKSFSKGKNFKKPFNNSYKGSKNFNPKNKGYNIKISQDTNQDNFKEDLISENLIQIGKFWESKNLIEPKNTTGNLLFIENQNLNSNSNSEENKDYILSLVEDSLLILNADDFSVFKTLKQNEETFISFAYNPMKRQIICSMSNSLIRIYDIDTLHCTKVWKLNKIVAKMIKVDPSYKFFAIAGSNNSILTYDLNNFNLINSFSPAHDGFIYDMAFNPDKEKYLLYSASEDGCVKIWDLILNKNISSLEGHSNGVRLIKLTNDGKSLISVTTDNNISIWKLSNDSSKNNLIITIPYNTSITSILYFTRNSTNNSKDLNLLPTLLLGCEDGSLNELNLKSTTNSNTTVKSNKPTSQAIHQIYYSNINSKLYCLTADQMIITFDINLVNEDISKAKLVNIYPGHCQEILDLKFLPGKNNKFLFSSNDNSIKYCEFITNSTDSTDLNDKKIKTNIKIIDGHEDFVMSINIKNDFISTSSKDGIVRIWQWNITDSEEFECTPVAILKGHTAAVNSSALILKKGNYKVVTGSKDSSLKVWDFISAIDEENIKFKTIKQSIHSEIAHDDEINLVKVSPNEKIIASGSYDKTIKVILFFLKIFYLDLE